MAKYRVIKSRRAYLRRRSVRRFLTLAIIVGVFVYAAYSTYHTRLNQLEEMRSELEVYREIYDEVMLRQGFYRNQILRLEDEDYVAMLARENLRSLPNEIIFRVIDVETMDEQLDMDDESSNEN